MAGRRIRVIVATVALGFLIALALGVAGIGSGTKALGANTALTVLGGDVLVRHGSGQFARAVDGELLNPGDAIKTGSDGRAVLTYFEGSSVTIEPSTELAIDAAAVHADGSTVVVMSQVVGRTWHVVTKLITGGSKYEVRTPASTASVRGTAFEVNNDATTTTVITTEGTVAALIADPDRAGATVDVPVTAGRAHTQTRNAPPAPTRPAPEPERKVTITVDAANSIVVDPFGRANGLTKDGKVVAQTPGAQVKRDGDKIVITLPDLPDGKVGTHIEKKSSDDRDDIDVDTKLEEKGEAAEVRGRTTDSGELKSTGVEIKRDASGTTSERVLEKDETNALPTPRVITESTRPFVPAATVRPPAPRPSAVPEPGTEAPAASPLRRAEATADTTRSQDVQRSSSAPEPRGPSLVPPLPQLPPLRGPRG